MSQASVGSKLLQKCSPGVRRLLFGRLPASLEDARSAVAAALGALEECDHDLAQREHLQEDTTAVRSTYEDIRRLVNDATLYLNTQHFGMCVSVAQRIKSLGDQLAELLSEYSDTAGVAELMEIVLEKQGPIYPPIVSRFHRFMRSQFGNFAA